MEHKPPRRDRLEGLLWLLFSAGGFLVAIVIPVHILLNNLAPALGLASPNIISYDSLSAVLSNPLFKLYFLALIAGAVYHGMHRLRFVLYEMGLKHQHIPVMIFEHTVDALIIGAAVYYILLA
ncbi:MAG: hypothetical protein HY619_00470 [Thaumarchaeota archaeon]|nr:hypothetical protein [Nitrososphaerota archaeon]